MDQRYVSLQPSALEKDADMFNRSDHPPDWRCCECLEGLEIRPSLHAPDCANGTLAKSFMDAKVRSQQAACRADNI